MNTKKITVSEKEYTLFFDYNTICDIEEEAGKSITSLFSEDLIGPSVIRILLKGGLQRYHRGITKQAVGFLVRQYMEEGGTVEELAMILVGLVAKAIGAKIEEEKPEEDDPAFTEAVL